MARGVCPDANVAEKCLRASDEVGLLYIYGPPLLFRAVAPSLLLGLLVLVLGLLDIPRYWYSIILALRLLTYTYGPSPLQRAAARNRKILYSCRFELWPRESQGR